MTRKIGVFLGFNPGIIKENQGIIKLLFSLMQSKSFRESCTIALPSWSYPELEALLSNVRGLQPHEISIISPRKKPHLIFALRDFVQRTIKKNREKKNKEKRIKNLQAQILDAILKFSVGNDFLFLILGAPLIFVILCLRFGIHLLIKVCRRIKSKFFSVIKLRVFTPFLHMLSTHVLSRMPALIREQEIKKLIKMINKRDDIDIWFIPTGFWPETKLINKKKIYAIPDLVFSEFPSLFRHPAWEASYYHMKETLSADAHFLCYSDHVKWEHLIKYHEIEREKISVVKHGNTDLSHWLKRDGHCPTAAAIQILESFQKNNLKKHAYLGDYYLPGLKFLFYSSQVRPHKNFLNLVKAYEILLRERFVNVKLIITGRPEHDPDLHSYIIQKRLQYDIISLHEVPNEVLSALNHLAICAVNPTLFEGGFPFTFCEAYSVGTPSVMSRIPVVLEDSQDEELNSLMLFDPYDINDMANKIEWAIFNREELLSLQKPLYEKFASRSWEITAKDYLNLFNDLTNKDSLSHTSC